MINFWISWHFNFAVQPKCYISRYFNFAVWPKYYNLRHFSLAVVLNIEFFMCASFQHFRNFGKSMEPKCRFKYIFNFFTHHWFTKVSKTPEKFLSGSKTSSSLSSESTTGFINPETWWLTLACQEALHNKIIIGYNKIMKSNDFRHLCDNVCSNEVSLLCFVKFAASVLFRFWKRKRYQKTRLGMDIVSSNNESEVP